MHNNMLVWTIRKVEWGGGSGGSIDYALSKFHAADPGFQLLDSSLCHLDLDSGFQSLAGFPIP